MLKIPILQSHGEWMGSIEVVEDAARNGVTAHTLSIGVPLQRWVLLKARSGVCALKFHEFHRDHPNDKGIRYFDESFYAEYSWYFDEHGTGKFQEEGGGSVSKKPNIWRFIRGDRFIECGDIIVEWAYPTTLSLIISEESHNPIFVSNGVSIAPTAWNSIDKVNTNENGITWYSYDESRGVKDARNYISIDQLVGPK